MFLTSVMLFVGSIISSGSHCKFIDNSLYYDLIRIITMAFFENASRPLIWGLVVFRALKTVP